MTVFNYYDLDKRFIRKVSINFIKNSFKCYDIFIELNKSEDDLLFDYENLLGLVNNNKEIEDPNDQSSDEEYFEKIIIKIIGILKMIQMKLIIKLIIKIMKVILSMVAFLKLIINSSQIWLQNYWRDSKVKGEKVGIKWNRLN